jgi:hypothetical protein
MVAKPLMTPEQGAAVLHLGAVETTAEEGEPAPAAFSERVARSAPAATQAEEGLAQMAVPEEAPARQGRPVMEARPVVAETAMKSARAGPSAVRAPAGTRGAVV